MMRDKMSIATGVEVQVPFLDDELAEYALRLKTGGRQQLFSRMMRELWLRMAVARRGQA